MSGEPTNLANSIQLIREFFESVPPSTIKEFELLVKSRKNEFGSSRHYLLLPPIYLHCSNALCNGVRLFETSGEILVEPDQPKNVFVTFFCRNCKINQKIYSLRVLLDEDGKRGALEKYGEAPAFGPPTPARVISIVGKERDYYLKGRKAENQGLGIAAFAYYRRVVENQKDKILDEIIKVAESSSGSEALVADLVAAKRETQFSTAIDKIKHGIPDTLKINGHNPLTLLHSALSEGLHAQTDEECLSLATSVRVVLTELVERIAQAVKEDKDLNAALSRLMKAKSEKKTDGS